MNKTSKIFISMLILFFLLATVIYMYISNTGSIIKENKIILVGGHEEKSLNYIPKVLHMTYHSKHSIPKKVYNNHSLYASDYDINIYDDDDGVKIIDKFFSNDVAVKYRQLNGPHKADLLRYCILYIYGGVYADIKTVFIQNLADVIPDGDHIVIVNSKFSDNTVYNGFIATPPGKKIFLSLINYILNIEIWVSKLYYLIFVHDCYSQIKMDIKDNNITSGFNEGYSTNYYVLDEACDRNSGNCNDGLDRYGLCCYIYDGDLPVIKTRYSDYPW